MDANAKKINDDGLADAMLFLGGTIAPKIEGMDLYQRAFYWSGILGVICGGADTSIGPLARVIVIRGMDEADKRKAN